MHAISSYRGNRHRPLSRPPATNTQTGPITVIGLRFELEDYYYCAKFQVIPIRSFRFIVLT